MKVPQSIQATNLYLFNLIVAKIENLELSEVRKDSFVDPCKFFVAEIESDQLDLVMEKRGKAALREVVVGEIEEEETVKIGEKVWRKREKRIVLKE